MKDEALSPVSFKMEHYPIPVLDEEQDQQWRVLGQSAGVHTKKIAYTTQVISTWLHLTFNMAKPGRALEAPHELDENSFVQAIKSALPKKRRLTAADIGELQREYRETVRPAREAAAELLRLERRLSDMVNAAYGLTPGEVQLMWETAPPRMPLDSAQELRRLKDANSV